MMRLSKPQIDFLIALNNAPNHRLPNGAIPGRPQTRRILFKNGLIEWDDRGGVILTKEGKIAGFANTANCRMSIACNHWENGLPRGKVGNVEIGGLGIASIMQLYGQDIRCKTLPEMGEPKTLHIGRFRIRLHGYATWVGNWCWDVAYIRWIDAVRILDYLKALDWHLQEAEESLWDRWDESGVIIEDLIKVLRKEKYE